MLVNNAIKDSKLMINNVFKHNNQIVLCLIVKLAMGIHVHHVIKDIMSHNPMVIKKKIINL